jgi:hypothetical protein
MKTTIRDILSVIKKDGRFKGNQKNLQQINIAISKAKGSRDNLIEFANEVKLILIK